MDLEVETGSQWKCMAAMGKSERGRDA